MASTDARPIPIKNTAYRVTFPLIDAAGALVTAATSPDSEVSKDNGTFADCTNEATEVATSSGIYYLDLTSTEMNADSVTVIVKSADTLTQVLVIYPQEAGDIKVDVQSISGDSTAADNLEAATDGTGYNIGNGSVVAASVTGAVGSVTGAVGSVTTVSDKTGYALSAGGVAAIWAALTSGLTTASSIGKLLVDNINATISSRSSHTAATGAAAVWNAVRASYTTAGSFGQGVASVQGNVTGSVASVTGAAGSVTGAVGSVTGNVGGNVTGSVGSVATGGITAASIAADAIGASELAADAVTEIQSGLATAAALATVDSNVDAILVDTAEIGAAGAGLTALATAANLALVKTVTDALGATAAARLALSATQMIVGTVSTAVGSPTTTVFWADDITEATTDHYVGRLVLWTTGALAGQVTDVTAYSLDTGEGKFTVTGMTEAAANNDTFLLV
jgi:hypothetical protein